MPSYSDPVLVCRPALPSDTDDVLEFTKFIWEGHDYIKYVWHEWLDDPQGLLATAQYGSHAVGIAKITLLSAGQWWLEGLHVDPKFQGLKIGSHLHEYMDRWWLRHGDGILRLMTSSERVQVHHLSERTGYTKTGEVADYRLDLAKSGVVARSAEGPAGVLPAGEATKQSHSPLARHNLSGQLPSMRCPPPLTRVHASRTLKRPHGFGLAILNPRRDEAGGAGLRRSPALVA